MVKRLIMPLSDKISKKLSRGKIGALDLWNFTVLSVLTNSEPRMLTPGCGIADKIGRSSIWNCGLEYCRFFECYSPTPWMKLSERLSILSLPRRRTRVLGRRARPNVELKRLPYSASL